MKNNERLKTVVYLLFYLFVSLDYYMLFKCVFLDDCGKNKIVS